MIGLPFLAVPVMAEAREGAGMSFVITARDVVENQRAVLEMTGCEFFFNPALSGDEPIESMI
jgi:hypothetical protein